MTTNATTTNTLRSASGNWIIGKVGPFEVQAKVFTEESTYGMPEDARISTLYVILPGEPTAVLYDYDRNDLVKNHLTTEGLNEIIAAIASKIA